MKAAIFLTTVLAATQLLAASTSVNCIVQKYDPKQGYNLSDNSTQVFKGPVSDEQYLLIDEKGRVTLTKRNDIFEGIDMTKTQLIVAQGLAGLVIVAQAQKQVSAMAKESAILNDNEKGTAVTCSLNPLP